MGRIALIAAAVAAVVIFATREERPAPAPTWQINAAPTTRLPADVEVPEAPRFALPGWRQIAPLGAQDLPGNDLEPSIVDPYRPHRIEVVPFVGPTEALAASLGPARAPLDPGHIGTLAKDRGYGVAGWWFESTGPSPGHVFLCLLAATDPQAPALGVVALIGSPDADLPSLARRAWDGLQQIGAAISK